MTAYSGLVRGVNLIAGSRGVGSNHAYELAIGITHASVPGDTITITGVPARIQESRKSGRTFNYLYAVPLNPCVDASGNKIGFGGTAIANSSGTLTLYLVTDQGTTAATATAMEGLSIAVFGYDT
ncbi:MAG: hypothetical protein WC551_07595 [Patescibacteria group bacterium]